MKRITKQLFLNAIVCPTLGWRMRSGDPLIESAAESPGLAEQFRMEQGQEIGQKARALFKGGVLVSAKDSRIASEETQSLLKKGPSYIFEATFIAGNYAAKADILEKDGKKWHIIEVKSGINSNQQRLYDLAYTVMVAMTAGLHISRASLMLVSKDFRLGMPDADLFEVVDRTSEVMPLAVSMGARSVEIDRETSGKVMPSPQLIKACKACLIFDSCMGKGVDHHCDDVPGPPRARV